MARISKIPLDNQTYKQVLDTLDLVLGKMKRANTKWNEAELKKATGDLVAIYHDTRFGLVDFETALERFCLTIGG